VKMGCDIHLFVEVKGKDGKWRIRRKSEEVKIGDSFSYKRSLFDPGRNYDLFAILANVRNGFGFAGVKTGDGFIPMSKPKGIPDDASDYYMKKAEDYGCDGHSHSWHTLKDLLEFPWKDKTATIQGVVDLATYEKWKAEGTLFPTSWCGGVSGGGIKVLDESEYPNIEKGAKNIYLKCRWVARYYDTCEYFMDTILPRLMALAGSKKPNPEKVRIVFFFDN